MKTKTRSPFKFDPEVPAENSTLARVAVPGVDVGPPEAEVTVVRSRARGTRLSDLPIASKPIEEIAVTMRLRADGLLHPCRCNGTGEDGCIIDSPLRSTNLKAGFASYSPPGVVGGGRHE